MFIPGWTTLSGHNYVYYGTYTSGTPDTTHTITCFWVVSMASTIGSTNATLGGAHGSLYVPPTVPTWEDVMFS